MPAFTVSPASCSARVVYEFDVNTDSNPIASGSMGSAVSFDPNFREFTFDYDGSLDLAGNLPNGKDYLLTVRAYLPSNKGNFFGAQATFNLNIKAPCYSSSFYSVTATQVPSFSYLLYSTFTPIAHDPFTVTATPEVLALCGGLTYSLNGGGLASYMGYNSVTREIDIYAENLGLLTGSPFTYTVSAQLAFFPGYGTASSNGQVTILNPC